MWSPLVKSISCKTCCFSIAHDHRLCVILFVWKKTPFIHNFWKIFHELQKCQRSSFICFFLAISPSTLIGSKFCQTKKMKKIFADIECEVWTMTFKMAFCTLATSLEKWERKVLFQKAAAHSRSNPSVPWLLLRLIQYPFLSVTEQWRPQGGWFQLNPSFSCNQKP